MNIYIDPRYKYLLFLAFHFSPIVHEISLPIPEIVGKFLSLLFETPPPTVPKYPRRPNSRPLAGQFGRKTRKFPEIVTANQFIPVALEKKEGKKKKKEGRKKRGGGGEESFGSRSFPKR